MFDKLEINNSIVDLFRQRVTRAGERIAVLTDTEQLTYAELDVASNRVANAIIAMRGFNEEAVLLVLDQGLASIVSTLGVLKAGKFYVPVDPTQPDFYLQNVARDCDAAAVICSNSTKELVSRICAVRTTRLVFEELSSESSTYESNVNLSPATSAYIFYTSGSTGKPKGVIDTHRNVLHNIMRYTNTLEIDDCDRLSLIQAPSFSGTVSSMFSALLNGATVLPYNVKSGGLAGLSSWVQRQGVTIFHSVPSIFRHLNAEPGSYPTVRLVRLEGDRVRYADIEHFRNHFDPPCILVNGLGLTECGLIRQYFIRHETPKESSIVPVGYPIVDMDIKLLDESGTEVPIGQVGEIVVHSEFLATGYWEKPVTTKQKFRPVPNSHEIRAYHTGDEGRLRPDGCLEYIGRADFQKKVRGQWVDLLEIEAALHAMAEIKDAVVETWIDPDEEARLVAYLVPRDAPLPPIYELRRRLIGRFPAHHIPAFFVALDQLPLTREGKLDRRQLGEPTPGRLNLTTPYLAPRCSLEKRLVDIWMEAFSADQIGVLDNFFELGGDSLTAAILMSLALDAGLTVTQRHIYDYPTIEMLTHFVAKVQPRYLSNASTTVPVPVPLTPAQDRFLRRRSKNPHHWNIAIHIETSNQWLVDLLRMAVWAVAEHHDALRLRFYPTPDGWRQYALSPNDITENDKRKTFEHVDLSGIDPTSVQSEIEERIRALQASLNLTSGPTFRLTYFTFGADRPNQLTLIAHHLVADRFSLVWVLKDLKTAYDRLATDERVVIPRRPRLYSSFAITLKQSANSAFARREIARYLHESWDELASLPRDFAKSAGENQNCAAHALTFEISPELTINLLRDTQFHAAELLLISLSQALMDWTDSKPFLIDVQRNGRALPLTEIDTVGTVGAFTYCTPLIMKVQIEDHDSRLLSIIQHVLSLRENGWVFDFVRCMTDDIDLRNQLNDLPSSEVLFNFQGTWPKVNTAGLMEIQSVIGESTHDPSGRRAYPIAVSTVLEGKSFRVTFVYSNKIHRRDTIEHLISSFDVYLTRLVAILGSQGGRPVSISASTS